MVTTEDGWSAANGFSLEGRCQMTPRDRIFSLEILLFSAKHLLYWVYRADLTKRLKEVTTDLLDPRDI